MILRQTGAPLPQLTAAGAGLTRLVELTGPGLDVAAAVRELGAVRDALDAVRPQLGQIGLSPWLLGEIDRVRGAASMLGDSLAELASQDGMARFDPEFAADDASWDAWFAEAAGIIGRAQQVVTAAP